MLSGQFPGSRGFCPKTRGSLSCSGSTGVAEGDYFGLLAQIGWECAGAVEVMPSEDWALAPVRARSCQREQTIDSRGTVGTSGGIAVAPLR